MSNYWVSDYMKSLSEKFQRLVTQHVSHPNPHEQGRIGDHLIEYETVNDSILSYVKLINAGEQIIVNNVNGYLQVGYII